MDLWKDNSSVVKGRLGGGFQFCTHLMVYYNTVLYFTNHHGIVF